MFRQKLMSRPGEMGALSEEQRPCAKRLSGIPPSDEDHLRGESGWRRREGKLQTRGQHTSISRLPLTQPGLASLSQPHSRIQWTSHQPFHRRIVYGSDETSWAILVRVSRCSAKIAFPAENIPVVIVRHPKPLPLKPSGRHFRSASLRSRPDVARCTFLQHSPPLLTVPLYCPTGA